MRFTPGLPRPRDRPSAARCASSPRLLSLPGGKLPSKFHPRSLMYAELYGRNSKFGMAVLGAFTMSFHPHVLSFEAARRAARAGTRLARQDSPPPYKRRTRVILIRTRPRGAEVKASFLLGVSTKAPSAYSRAHTRRRISEMHFRGALPRKRTLVPSFPLRAGAFRERTVVRKS